MADKPSVISGVPTPTPKIHYSGAFSPTTAPKKNFFGNLIDGAVYGSYSRNDSGSATLGQIGAGLIPGVGQLADARDTLAAYEKVRDGEAGGRFELGLALLGWIPLAGDWGKNLLRGSKDSLFDFAAGSKNWFSRQFDSLSETVSSWFYKPTVVGDPFLEAGTGFTDKFGNVQYSMLGSKVDQALVREHELVHSFLSPKFKFLQEFRADIRMSAYEKSSFMRYMEEAMAETYAQLKVNGLQGIPSGLSFPITNGYVKLEDVVTEGALGALAVGGVNYGVYVIAGDNN